MKKFNRALGFCLLLALVFSLSSCFNSGKKETGLKQSILQGGKKKKAAYSKFLVPDRPNVLAFFMEACPACRRTKPVFEEISGKYPTISIKKFIFEKDQETIRSLGVSSFPTIVFFDQSGKEVKTVVGEMDKAKLQALFQKLSEKKENKENKESKE